MKTTWLPQLKQSMRSTAQGLVSACALPATLAVDLTVAQIIVAMYSRAASIINKLNTNLNTRIDNGIGNGIAYINRRSKHIRNEQSQSVSFKAYSTPYSRIRRENLQVAGAS